MLSVAPNFAFRIKTLGRILKNRSAHFTWYFPELLFVLYPARVCYLKILPLPRIVDGKPYLSL